MANEQVNDLNNEEQEEVQHQPSEQEEELTDEETLEENSADEETSEYIQKLEKDQEEIKSNMLRLQADYDNFRRRTKAESSAAAKYRSQNLAEQLLPVIDNFERALNVETQSEEASSLLEGMEIVYRQLTEALEKENIKEIEAKGEPFDPERHQAVMQVEEDGYESNVVIEVLQKGYQLNDRVIRPAMVKVNA